LRKDSWGTIKDMSVVDSVLISDLDNCVTLAGAACVGDTVRYSGGGAEITVTARESIPIWHKMAVRPVEKGGAVFKYGAAIGVALVNIEAGQHVHVHNIAGCPIAQGDGSVVLLNNTTEPSPCVHSFLGYKRPDGKTGVRNHVVVMPGVICADVAARKIAAAAGAVYLHNPHGCGQTSADNERTLHILSGLLANPNVFGALIVGLGCEFLGEGRYMDAVQRKSPGKPLRYACIQADGGIAATVEKGIAEVRLLLAEAEECVRTPCDVSGLVLGLECGGSDPTSGISANVVLGEVSDRLVDMGGTVVISETVEAIGAEHILLQRGATPEIGKAIYACVREKDAAFKALGENIRGRNPSPGNIRAGISTLEEKSLGCINKSGSRPFTALVGYGDMVDVRGVVFMDTTAFDAASVTAKIAGGCQVVVFTTGLGNPIGNAISPVIKMTGNRETFDKLRDMLDFESGGTLTGEITISESADELMELIIRVCSDERVMAEINGADVVSIDQHHMLA
jgi:altronate dehydratase large subunit